MGLIDTPMHDTTPVRESVFSCTGVSLQLVGRRGATARLLGAAAAVEARLQA